jgi:cell wall assembly regulator SMI1
MQKFTRALTREIEIAGERLAVTLDKDGVTVRPVGSRRPPHHVGWPAVVCAVTGALPTADEPTEQELADALAALKAGARSAVPAAGKAPGPAAGHAAVAPTPLPLSAAAGDVPSLLARLDDWLAKHRPRYHAGLLPGAGAGDLDALAQVIGKPLPQELRQWLGWHNGQHDEMIGSFYEAFNLMSAAQIAAAWQDRSAGPIAGWDSSWIPLLDDYQDDLIVLDPAEPGCAAREVWRGRDEHPVVAPTLAAWLGRFVADVEAGRYHEDRERGEFRRVGK